MEKYLTLNGLLSSTKITPSMSIAVAVFSWYHEKKIRYNLTNFILIYGDSRKSRNSFACKIREISRHRPPRLSSINLSVSIVALCPFAVPSTPFRRRCGNVPWKWFVITAVAGIRADEANIPSSVRAILNPREIDFATTPLVSRVNTRRCAKVGNHQKDHTHIHIHPCTHTRCSYFLIYSILEERNTIFVSCWTSTSRKKKLFYFSIIVIYSCGIWY